MHSPGLHFLPLRAAFAPTGAFVVRRILFFFLTPLNPQHATADGTRRTAHSGNRGRCTAAHNSAPVALMESSAPHSPYASSVASRPIGDSSTIRNWACGGISPTAACCTRMCRRSIRSRRRLRHGMPQAPRRSQQRRLIPTYRPKSGARPHRGRPHQGGKRTHRPHPIPRGRHRLPRRAGSQPCRQRHLSASAHHTR